MNWIIESKPVDTYEISPTDTQHEYLVYVKDEAGRNIDGALAYGKEDRKKVTNEFISKYNEYITKIEHSENFKQ
tara:strand:- start:950 stop:1171 length:222 start_codon:yes stop_codon:yes gene_type:complete